MPTPASPSPGFVRPGATTASKSSTGPHGRKSGRQRVPSGAPFFRSTTPSASSNRRESSGPALEINSKPRQNGQSRAEQTKRFYNESGWKERNGESIDRDLFGVKEDGPIRSELHRL